MPEENKDPKEKFKAALKHFDSVLIRLGVIILYALLLWFIQKIGVKPEEIGHAIKTFNANFGPGLPDANRKPVMKEVPNGK